MSTDWVSAGSNLVMVFIWLIYLQFFYFSYRRSNRPFMIIHHAGGSTLNSSCLFVNMSKEPIHVQSVVAYIKTGEGIKSCFITDYDRHSPEDTQAGDALREGPIQPGGYLVLGSFADIIRCGPAVSDERDTSRDLSDCESLQLCVAVTHGPSQHLIGARRSFNIHSGGKDDARLQAQSIYTEQLTRRSKRKDVRQWVQERLQPEYDSESKDRDSVQSLE